MNSIRFSTLSPNRWSEYKAIRLEALKTNPTAYLDTYDKVAALPDEKWQKDLNNSETAHGCLLLFAFDGEKIIGMGGAYWRVQPGVRVPAEIYGVYINPSYRGLGLAKKLLNLVIAQISKNTEITAITLGVNADNMLARRLYESLGLQVVGKMAEMVRFGGELHEVVLMEKPVH